MEYAVLSQCYDALVGADYESIAHFYVSGTVQLSQSPSLP